MEDDSTLFSKREKKLFAIFKMAIEAKQDAQKMYRQAQRFCDDPVLKKILQGMEREETAHEKELSRWYARIMKQVRDEHASLDLIPATRTGRPRFHSPGN